jgi:hypothetical protein
VTDLNELVDMIADVLADRVATRMAERFAPPTVTPASARVDAKTLADALGVSRGFVYEHADELGAERLGPGARARLRFDVEGARAAMARSQSRTSEGETVNDDGGSPTPPDAEGARLPDRPPKSAPRRPSPVKVDPNAVLPIRRPRAGPSSVIEATRGTLEDE